MDQQPVDFVGGHQNPGQGFGELGHIGVECQVHRVVDAGMAGHVLLQPLLERCVVVELNQEASFEDHFTDCLLLEAMEL